MLGEYIAETAATKGVEAISTRVLEAASRDDRLAAQLGNQLGLDPLGRARLSVAGAQEQHAAASLQDLAAQGRAARQAAGQGDPNQEKDDV